MAKKDPVDRDRGQVMMCGEVLWLVYEVVWFLCEGEEDRGVAEKCVKLLKEMWKECEVVRGEVVRVTLDFIKRANEENVVVNKTGMAMLMTALADSPPVYITPSKPIPLTNLVSSTITPPDAWDDSQIESLLDLLLSLPLTFPIARWVLSVLRGLSRNIRYGLLEKYLENSAVVAAKTAVTRDTPPTVTKGSVWLLTYCIIGYQKSGDLLSKVGPYIEMMIKEEGGYSKVGSEEKPSASLFDQLRPHRCVRSRVAVAVVHSRIRLKEEASAVKNCFIDCFKEYKKYLELTQEEMKTVLAVVERHNTSYRLLPGRPGPPAAKPRHTQSTLNYYQPTKICKGITGLVNMGNTCFMASYVQAVYFVRGLREAILSVPCHDGGLDVERWLRCPTLYHLGMLLGGMEVTNEPAVKPSGLYKTLPPFFRDYRQHDANEFGYTLLSLLEEEVKANFPPATLAYFTSHYTGRTSRKVECKDCGGVSIKTEPFTALNLMYPEGDCTPTSVDKMLRRSLVTEEQLEEANQYDCEKCGRKTDAVVRAEVDRLPAYLTLVLGRFRYDVRQGVRRKVMIETDVAESLDVPVGGETKKYTLCSVVAHSGETAQTGHYYCLGKKDKSWYTMNDSISLATPNPAPRTPTSVPYILFYAETPPPPPPSALITSTTYFADHLSFELTPAPSKNSKEPPPKAPRIKGPDDSDSDPEIQPTSDPSQQ
eukprot:TRINITY_DN951_c2_g1_i1.p1 TRINITY_DN951_c2_g1~~TRINITY_DN951_c2_g1_i1.p1  ORF type:complete len:707 (+),score=140.97 TRINITY_DN951_c2_g1_i1:57-2177(+)